MALAAVVDTLESVPEALRTEYAEKDGKFYLAIDGVDNHHAVGGLKSALANERLANKGLKDLKAKYDSLGLSHDEIAELVSRDAAAAAEALRKKGDVEGVLKQHRDKWDKEKGELSTKADRAEAAARKAVVNSGLLGELAKVKAMLDQPGATDFLTFQLGKRVDLKFDENGEAVVSVLAADGKSPMAGSGADGFATMADLAKEAIKNWPHLFEGTGTGGGGAPPKGGPAGAKVLTRADLEKLTPADRIAKLKDGFKVVD